MELITETDFTLAIVIVVGMFIGGIAGSKLIQKIDPESPAFFKIFWVASGALAGSLILLIISILAICFPFVMLSAAVVVFFVYRKMTAGKRNKVAR